MTAGEGKKKLLCDFHPSEETVKRSERNVVCTAVIQQEAVVFTETLELTIHKCMCFLNKENTINFYRIINFRKSWFPSEPSFHLVKAGKVSKGGLFPNDAVLPLKQTGGSWVQSEQERLAGRSCSGARYTVSL